ncbi:MAG: sigma-70 family RNA polymerase sigma factor [Planctomycetota bacterium]
MSGTPDPETLRKAAGGDAAAFETIFARNMPGLVAFVRSRLGARLAARESATDIAQSVFREGLEDLDDFEYRGEEAFRGWVYQQAVRKILDRNRYYGRDRRDIGREVSPGAGSDDDAPSLMDALGTIATPSRHASAREELARFEAALAELPENQRDAVMMSRVMGMEYADIGDVMGVTASAVRGLVARGLATVADSLE